MPYNAPFESPYDPSQTQPLTDPETLPFDEIILDAMDSWGLARHMALPCSVVNLYDSKNQQVDLQPMLQARYKNTTTPVTLPIITNVPVVMPMGKNFSIKVPLSIGDTGLAIFSDRSLDVWLSSDGSSPVDPQDTRQHDITDAVFIPGLVPFASQGTDDSDDLVITAGKAQVRLQQSGTFLVQQEGGDSLELFNLLSEFLSNQINLLNTLATQTFTLTMLGPEPFIASTVAALNQLKATAQQLQNSVNQLKGSNDA